VQQDETNTCAAADTIDGDAAAAAGNTHTEDSFVGSRTTRTAGKAARYIKDYILKHVLPFDGQCACLFIPHAPPSIHASHASCSSTAPPLPVTARDEQRPAD